MTDRYHARLSHEDALEDFGQVPEVEGVMRLGRGREQLGGNGSVDPDGGVHKRLVQWLDSRHRF